MNDIELLTQTEHVSDIFTRVMLKIMTEDLSGEEITPAQFQALKHIVQHGPCTIGSIAEGLSVSQPAATMLIDRLAKRGLVDRQTGRHDRRQAEVSLTPHAAELIRQLEADRTERLGRILELMTPQERGQFVESLERFVAAALKIEDVDEACLRCGIEHREGCIVNKTHLELAGHQIEKT